MANALFATAFSELFDNLSITEFLQREGSFAIRSDNVVVLNFCKSYQLEDRKMQLIVGINLAAQESLWLMYINATGVCYNETNTDFQFFAEPISGTRSLIKEKLTQTLLWLEETIKNPYPFEMLKL